MAPLGSQARRPIFAQSETLFFLTVVDAQIEFAADGSALVLHQNGRSTPRGADSHAYAGTGP